MTSRYFNASSMRYIFLSLLVFMLIWLPYAMTIFWQIEFISTGNESLAYRYFLSERAWLGMPSFIWQGHLATNIHNLIYAILHLPLLAATDFREQLQNFGQSSLAMTLLLISCFFALALRDKHLQFMDKILVGVTAISSIYGLDGMGLYYLFLPDYYAISISLLVATVWITLRVMRSTAVDDSTFFLSILIGVFCGLWMSNKLTSVLILLPAVAMLAQRASWRHLLVLAATASFTLITMFSIYYLGNIQDILGFPAKWIKAVAESQGEGAGNVLEWLKQSFHGPYGSVFICSLLCGIVSTISVYWHGIMRSVRIAIGVSWLVFCIFFLVLVERPSGTTLFEAMLLWTMLCCLWIGLIPQKILRKAVVGAIVLVQALSLSPTLETSDRLYSKSHEEAETQWALFNNVMRLANGRPVWVMLADNNYGNGSVFELFLKGVSDFPTWHVSEVGERLIDRHYPKLRFAHGAEWTAAKPVPKDTVIVWFEKQGFALVTSMFSDLARIEQSPDYHCTQQPTMQQVVAHVCTPLP